MKRAASGGIALVFRLLLSATLAAMLFIPVTVVHSEDAIVSVKPQPSQPTPDFDQMLERLTGGVSQADAQIFVERTRRKFDHTQTGFPLTGAHVIVECATCHPGGIFKGAPRNCAGCHTKGRRIIATAMSFNHIATIEPCEVCHTNSVTFLGARYNHGMAKPGSCSTCHNGRIATGKTASHSSGLRATESCDRCHRSVAWIPTTFNHAAVVTGSCSNCHNSSTYPSGKPANHASGGRAVYACDSCHGTTRWSPATYNHSGASICANCHSYVTGSNFTPVKANHISTTSGCEVCHRSYTTWLGASGHTGNEANRCLECHLAKRPSNHTSTAYLASCDACHTTTSWAFNHAAQQGKHTCASCHLAKAAEEHGTPAVGSRYYNCDNSGCHTVDTWDR